MWIFLAVLSALLLGVYDIFKKLSVNGNNVLTVLLYNTFFGALIMSPIVVMGIIGDASVLGGVKLRFMGKQLDASLKSRLDAIGSALQSTALGVENSRK